MSKNRQRQRLNKLDRMSVSELEGRLSDTESSITEREPRCSWGKTSYEMPKGIRTERRRLKAAIERAKDREGHMKQAQERGNKKANPNAPLVNPDTARVGTVVKEFIDRAMFIEKADGGFIIRRKSHGNAVYMGESGTYEEAVRKADRLFRDLSRSENRRGGYGGGWGW